MGYSHYFGWDPLHNCWPEAYGHLALDAKRIVEHAEGAHDLRLSTFSEISEGRVMLFPHGRGGSLLIEATPYWTLDDPPPDWAADRWLWESLRKDQYGYMAETHTSFEFIGTLRQPYDAIAGAVLLRLAHHCGRLGVPVRVSSDGHWEYEWLHGPLVWPATPTYPAGTEASTSVRQLVTEAFDHEPACPWEHTP